MSTRGFTNGFSLPPSSEASQDDGINWSAVYKPRPRTLRRTSAAAGDVVMPAVVGADIHEQARYLSVNDTMHPRGAVTADFHNVPPLHAPGVAVPGRTMTRSAMSDDGIATHREKRLRMGLNFKSTSMTHAHPSVLHPPSDHSPVTRLGSAPAATPYASAFTRVSAVGGGSSTSLASSASSLTASERSTMSADARMDSVSSDSTAASVQSSQTSGGQPSYSISHQQMQHVHVSPDGKRIALPGMMATDGSGEPQLVRGVLVITEQPAERGRFRYMKEKRNTPLHGRRDGTFPTVALSQKFRGRIEDGTMVDVTIVTKDSDPASPKKHWHMLEGKDGESTLRPLRGGRATFPHLVVTRGSSDGAQRRSTEDQQVIRLMFSMLFRLNGTMYQTRVLSDPIHGRDLKLHKLSHGSVSVGGGEVIMLTSKVKRGTVRVKITDKYHSWRSGASINGWQLDGHGRPFVDVSDLHVHYQYALVVKLPPYWDMNITTARSVDIMLVDSDQQSSALTIEYVPLPPLSMSYRAINSRSVSPLFAIPREPITSSLGTGSNTLDVPPPQQHSLGWGSEVPALGTAAESDELDDAMQDDSTHNAFRPAGGEGMFNSRASTVFNLAGSYETSL